MRVLLITPPMMQLNAPYAAGPHLAGFLRQNGVDVVQADASLSLALELFSRRGIESIRRDILKKGRRSAAVRHFLAHTVRYAATVEPVVRFLQGKNPPRAAKLAGRRFLPEGPRFAVLAENPVFESLDISDKAKYLASLYIDDLADVIREGVDARFELSRYGETLAVSAPSFGPIRKALEARPSLVDRLLDRMADDLISKHRPGLVAFTVPFPGNLYGALRLARRIKQKHPSIPIALGGGYVNTELRGLREPRLFDYVDFVTLDAGERPLRNLIAHLEGRRSVQELCRTFVRRGGSVQFITGVCSDVALSDTGVPDYKGLMLGRYVSLCEMPNPMHRLWSDGHWNKLMLARGCYWRKCAFCDTTLDYICRFDPASADELVDRIEAVIAATGSRGFHFVDEATPPALLKAVAERLLARRVKIEWWTNIRFEKTFTPALCRLLAKSGCVAVTGGLETVTDRLLKLMNKGVTLPQAARAMKAFADAGIMVHAYLMYGFPSQTEQDTVDALEIVRQLFGAGYVQSAYWHRFALTVHSSIHRAPAKYGLRLLPMPAGGFAVNEAAYRDSVKCDHLRLGQGLRKAIYNYMHGVGLDFDVQSWFTGNVPRPGVRRDYVERILRA